MKHLLRGGTIVSGSGQRKADILIEEGKIAAVGEHLELEEGRITDVSGMLIFPGFIDAHTHMALEVSQTVTADLFDTGTKAQLVSGTTCILDFATQYAGETLAQALEHWHEKADGQSSCDYAFHLALSEWNEDLEKELDEIVRKEVSSFKMYMTYDNRVDDETLYRILVKLKERGAIAGVHCENHGLIQGRQKELLEKKGSRESVSDYPWTRPEEAEAEAVSRLLKIARCADAPVILVHLSTAAGYREVERAREMGQTVYVETCPQYLVLDESKYSLPPEEARRYMIAPPLRKKEDQERLWKAFSDGEIQTIATDHCSFRTDQKEAGREDFTRTPCGMPGAFERPALIWQFGVRAGRITVEQMCAALSENAAKLYRLYPRKGAIQPGSDADLVVWNPDTEWTIMAKNSPSACDYSPAEGVQIRGKAKQVYLRGELVAEDGVVRKEKKGIYLSHGTEQ